MQLPELFGNIIARKKRMTSSKDFSVNQKSISCEQPSVLLQNSFNKDRILYISNVGRVEPEHAKPTCKLSEHRIGKEGEGRTLLWSSHTSIVYTIIPF